MTDLSIAVGGPEAVPPAPGDSVLGWFEHWVARQPDAPAVVDGTVSWSYGELDAAATLLAKKLTGRVLPGDRVGVCLDRSPQLVAAAVALARLDAVYLPLGPTPGPSRLSTLAEEGAVDCLLTGEADVAPEGWRTHPLEETGLDLARPVQEIAAPRASDAFYAVSTSGTTGAPKVILVPEAALANLVRWYCREHEMGPGTRVSLMVGPTFDPHLKELWAALCSGSALHVAPEDARLSTGDLFQWWEQAGITSCILPTPLAELAFTRQWPSELALRHISVGGDRMRTRPPADCAATVHNMYGPAEATCVITSHRVERAPADAEAAVPIGVPMSRVTVFVTDPDGGVLPRGEAGELRVGGAGLALGYVNAALTAERFVQAPAGHAGTVYRTGDKVRMTADGVLEFLGRLDNQVKISGARIEPAEVEAALERHSAVRQAVAVTLPVAGGELRLIGFAQLAEDASAEPAQILRVAREHLIPQAVPTTLHLVKEFPLNANGKIDRTALAEQAADQVQPSTVAETEEFLVATSRLLLGVTTLGPEDNFADSGGASLAAARLLAVIEATYGIRMKATEVMRQPDLRSLAVLVAERRAATAEARS
ncbi:amino acid adenylation domain-containing protein [Streptomyces sp. AGS-58]|uniref:amino acid adenylation domain-containing protein n=1 Tax=unclassified Streptomyces TaxID=2593676 RepID=UPI0035A3484F